MEPRPRVAVIGAGVSGLATAVALVRADGSVRPEVVVLEGDDRLGGKVMTTQLDGLPVDTGPDSLLVRVPAVGALLDSLGLGDAVVPAASLGAYLWSGHRLRRLPPGTSFGVPDRVGPLVRSRLLSPAGLLRAGLDLVLPRTALDRDPSVAQVLRPRFGSQLTRRLVEPLLGGVHAGSTDQLSARSVVPDIEALARGHRSLFLALRARARKAPAPTGAALVTLRGGLGELISALRTALSGAEVRTGARVTALERTADGFRVVVGQQIVHADAVVLATPAYTTAGLVEGLAPAASVALREVPYVDVATVTLTYPRASVRRQLDATGFLVPPEEGRLLVGCSWLSVKWPYLGEGPSVVIRAMVGRAGDRRWTDLDDDALVRRVHAELDEAMGGLAGPPTHWHVQRWPQALPQYTVGHGDRLALVDAALAQVPGLFVTGAAYRGVGVAGCIAQAEQTAKAVLAQLASRSEAQEALT